MMDKKPRTPEEKQTRYVLVPEDLDALAPEERHHLYKMLRLGVVSNADRSLHVSGALAGTLEDEFRPLETVSRYRFKDAKSYELRFRVLLTEDGTRRIELMRV
jgi:hypothetical protein